MAPPRLNGPLPANAAKRSGVVAFPQSFDQLKARVLSKLEDRLDPTTSKRMPPSLLRQSIRTHAEQIAEQETRGASRAERDRLVEAVLEELLGYGPLSELLRDPTVREVMVAGPHAVIVRREASPWLPTSVKYRDEDHLRWSLDRLATHADPVGPVLASVNMFDLQLPNGFRVMAVIPPPALGQPAIASFIRAEAPSATTETPAAASASRTTSATGSASAATTPRPGGITVSPRPGSSIVTTPAPRAAPEASPHVDALARHRSRIIELLIGKFASLGVYDLARVEITELRRVVTAYVREYVENEKIYMSETDQCRLMIEILTSMHR